MITFFPCKRILTFLGIGLIIILSAFTLVSPAPPPISSQRELIIISQKGGTKILTSPTLSYEYYVQGTIKNNSDQTISDIKIKADFYSLREESSPSKYEGSRYLTIEELAPQKTNSFEIKGPVVELKHPLKAKYQISIEGYSKTPPQISMEEKKVPYRMGPLLKQEPEERKSDIEEQSEGSFVEGNEAYRSGKKSDIEEQLEYLLVEGIEASCDPNEWQKAIEHLEDYLKKKQNIKQGEDKEVKDTLAEYYINEAERLKKKGNLKKAERYLSKAIQMAWSLDILLKYIEIKIFIYYDKINSLLLPLLFLIVIFGLPILIMRHYRKKADRIPNKGIAFRLFLKIFYIRRVFPVLGHRIGIKDLKSIQECYKSSSLWTSESILVNLKPRELNIWFKILKTNLPSVFQENRPLGEGLVIALYDLIPTNPKFEKDGLEILERLVPFPPVSWILNDRLAKLYFKFGESLKALQILKELSKIESQQKNIIRLLDHFNERSDHPSFWFESARIYSTLGKTEKAIDIYRKLYGIESLNEGMKKEVIYLLGKNLLESSMSLKDTNKEIDILIDFWFHAVREDRKTDSQLTESKLLGFLETHNNLEKKIQILEKIRKYGFGSIIFQERLAYLYLARYEKRLEEADVLEEVFLLNNHLQQQLAYYLAKVYTSNNQCEKAVNVLQKVLQKEFTSASGDERDTIEEITELCLQYSNEFLKQKGLYVVNCYNIAF